MRYKYCFQFKWKTVQILIKGMYMSLSFISQIQPSEPMCEAALFFFFHGEDLLLIIDSDKYTIPLLYNLEPYYPYIERQVFMGLYNDKACYAASLSEKPKTLSEQISFQHIRLSHELLNDNQTFSIVSKAKQLLNWDLNSLYCGKCGHINELSKSERAKQCSHCHFMSFPQIAPAMLVLVWREKQILLARSPQFNPGVYSILAGFVEPGETLEQTVMREVKEEAGISIKNLQYVGSQSWPFPSNLMLGFSAEYDDGELIFDRKELEDAQWFSLDNLPKLPKPISVSRLMIDEHLAKYR